MRYPKHRQNGKHAEALATYLKYHVMDILQISKGPTFLAQRHGWDQAQGRPYYFRGLPPHTPNVMRLEESS